MRTLKFTKMHGIGNDFILINCLKAKLSNPKEFAMKFCNRRFGIGADQIILLYPSKIADFKMLIFNADGDEVEMCGNGIRCLAKYIWDNKLSNKKILEIETLAGIIKPERVSHLIKVHMGKPIFEAAKIPVKINRKNRNIIDYPLRIKDKNFKITCVSMGNPHTIIFLDTDVSKFPVRFYGEEIEHHKLFPKRTNVEFVNVKDRKELIMRVWERGSGETLGCGTGACASAVVSMIKGLTDKKVVVHLLGGDLTVEWDENNNVFMTGPAEKAFEGFVKI